MVTIFFYGFQLTILQLRNCVVSADPADPADPAVEKNTYGLKFMLSCLKKFVLLFQFLACNMSDAKGRLNYH